ncbi:unnamed protein product [Sphacelaria rigidula]
MINVVGKRCGEKRCLKRPSFGVAGSKKTEFCFEHAAAGMINVVSKRCGDEGCLKHPSYSVAGSKKAVLCSAHAREGMAHVGNKKYSDEGCFKYPSYGVAGSKKREFCFEHARAGMVNVKRRCYHEACLKHPWYGETRNKEAKYFSEHVEAGIVGTKHVNSGKKGYSEPCASKGHNLDEAQCCRQHNITHNAGTVHNAAKLNIMVDPTSRRPTDVGGSFVADVHGIGCTRAGCSASGSCAVVGTRRCVCQRTRRGGTTLPLPSAQVPSGADAQVSPEARTGAGIKVEPAAHFSAHCGTWVSDRREQVTCSSGSSSVGVSSSSSSSSSGVDTGWLYDSSVVVSGCLARLIIYKLKGQR